MCTAKLSSVALEFILFVILAANFSAAYKLQINNKYNVIKENKEKKKKNRNKELKKRKRRKRKGREEYPFIIGIQFEGVTEVVDVLLTSEFRQACSHHLIIKC